MPETIYVCEICGRMFDTLKEAETCEAEHDAPASTD